ncbi:unnamed protein product [Protopolystoma xenopodis]|uniref:Uncharacterized protein n=1 Tax=Protopolystoma xenopodis TaxID=117903 RepID=A0A448WU54_9PLAT|nr:unnamed protein product [Protopolystoma xenopodis]
MFTNGKVPCSYYMYRLEKFALLYDTAQIITLFDVSIPHYEKTQNETTKDMNGLRPLNPNGACLHEVKTHSSCVNSLVSSIAFSLILGFDLQGTLRLVAWTLLFDFIGVACLIATILWVAVNHWMLMYQAEEKNNSSPRRTYSKRTPVSLEDQEPLKVEWAYALDVHINAYLPAFTTIHIFQLPFVYHVIYRDWLAFLIIGNTFWLVSCLYYLYIVFLGFNSKSL